MVAAARQALGLSRKDYDPFWSPVPKQTRLRARRPEAMSVAERRLDVRRYRFAVSPAPRDDPTNAPDFPFDVARGLLADRLPEVPQLRYPSSRSAAGLAWSSMTAMTGVGANGR